VLGRNSISETKQAGRMDKAEKRRTNAERLGPLLEERVLGLLLSLGVYSTTKNFSESASARREAKEGKSEGRSGNVQGAGATFFPLATALG
jgi:hypothetical protein